MGSFLQARRSVARSVDRAGSVVGISGDAALRNPHSAVHLDAVFESRADGGHGHTAHTGEPRRRHDAL